MHLEGWQQKLQEPVQTFPPEHMRNCAHLTFCLRVPDDSHSDIQGRKHWEARSDIHCIRQRKRLGMSMMVCWHICKRAMRGMYFYT